MLRVALTGGIATGKSYALEQFQRRGVPCLDADELAHGVTAAGTEATQAIVVRFGEQVLGPDGTLNRGVLGRIVFADPAARKDLEAIVHPGVYRAITAGLRAIELTDKPPLAVVDIPLLYETGHAADFNRVIVTSCSRDVQVARLLKRGMTEREAEQRLAAQMPTEEKAARADYVIDTSGTYEATNAQISNILAKLTQVQRPVL
jgi:dephospho-CoA kinase